LRDFKEIIHLEIKLDHNFHPQVILNLYDFYNVETKDFEDGSIWFCPCNESQWGPEQHRTPLTFIVLTKKIKNV